VFAHDHLELFEPLSKLTGAAQQLIAVTSLAVAASRGTHVSNSDDVNTCLILTSSNRFAHVRVQQRSQHSLPVSWATLGARLRPALNHLAPSRSLNHKELLSAVLFPDASAVPYSTPLPAASAFGESYFSMACCKGVQNIPGLKDGVVKLPLVQVFKYCLPVQAWC